jgi:hypothetical protein
VLSSRRLFLFPQERKAWDEAFAKVNIVVKCLDSAIDYIIIIALQGSKAPIGNVLTSGFPLPLKV